MTSKKGVRPLSRAKLLQLQERALAGDRAAVYADLIRDSVEDVNGSAVIAEIGAYLGEWPTVQAASQVVISRGDQVFHYRNSIVHSMALWLRARGVLGSSDTFEWLEALELAIFPNGEPRSPLVRNAEELYRTFLRSARGIEPWPWADPVQIGPRADNTVVEAKKVEFSTAAIARQLLGAVAVGDQRWAIACLRELDPDDTTLSYTTLEAAAAMAIASGETELGREALLRNAWRWRPGTLTEACPLGPVLHGGFIATLDQGDLRELLATPSRR